MNMNRLVNMALRMLMQKGAELTATRGKRAEDMTPEERAQAKDARQTARKAQRGLRALRRFMR